MHSFSRGGGGDESSPHHATKRRVMLLLSYTLFIYHSPRRPLPPPPRCLQSRVNVIKLFSLSLMLRTNRQVFVLGKTFQPKPNICKSLRNSSRKCGTRLINWKHSSLFENRICEKEDKKFPNIDSESTYKNLISFRIIYSTWTCTLKLFTAVIHFKS